MRSSVRLVVEVAVMTTSALASVRQLYAASSPQLTSALVSLRGTLRAKLPRRRLLITRSSSGSP